jgi:hypothetical protein
MHRMTSQEVRPLTGVELAAVSGGVITTFQYGGFKLDIEAGAGWHRLEAQCPDGGGWAYTHYGN